MNRRSGAGLLSTGRRSLRCVQPAHRGAARDQHDVWPVPLTLLLAATGLLLAAVQLSIGELADYPGEIRAVLSYTGLVLAAAALAAMVIIRSA